MRSETVLVFPSSIPAANSFLNVCRNLGVPVVGASSVSRDTNSEKFDSWFWLPMVNAPDFEQAFIAALGKYKIGRVFSPVNAAHQRIAQIVEENDLPITLLPRPFDAELASYKCLSVRVEEANSLIHAIAGINSRLSSNQIAAVLRTADGIWGQCGEIKIAAIMAAMMSAPKGDVVEIGALFGKSAAVLILLARWLGIGNVLAIDPWAAEASLQVDAPKYIQDLSQGEYWDDIASAFLVNLAPLIDHNFNYVKATSTEAIPYYESGLITSSQFGATQFSGGISLLHIDGNHDYDEVIKDASLWLPRVIAGGWIIFDDYCWAHSDGPRRVADRVLDRHADSISEAFVCDGAMFLKLGSSLQVKLQ